MPVRPFLDGVNLGRKPIIAQRFTRRGTIEGLNGGTLSATVWSDEDGDGKRKLNFHVPLQIPVKREPDKLDIVRKGASSLPLGNLSNQILRWGHPMDGK